MKHWGALIELFVVIMFAAGWGILELVTRRMDRHREAASSDASASDSRHPKG
jgi:hypothetical protein